jgi:MFS family permease
MKFKEMGIYSALPLIGGACGGAFGGYLNDRLIRTGRNRRWIRSLIGLSGKGTAGVLIVVALYSSFDNPYRFCVLLFFVKFFADVSLATRWGAVSDVGGKATASVFGFNNTVASIGAIAAPVMYGYVSEHASWEAVFIIGGVMYALCAASWLLIDCTIPLVRDVEPT